MKTLKLLVLATALAAAPACKKKKTEPAPAPTMEPGSASGAAPTPGSASGATDPNAGSAGSAGSAADPNAGSGSAATTTPDAAAADNLTILAEHGPEKKPDDPVKVVFDKVTVKKADFDPAKIEGGTATIEVDLTSLKSGSEKRDGHLATPDYIDSAKFATATIDVSNVKKKDDTHFTADAKVKLRDTEKTYPVTFEVLDKTADSIRVKGEHKFNRLDFKVGKDKLGKDEGVQFELTAHLTLTLKKT